jgi:hypothetical protein
VTDIDLGSTERWRPSPPCSTPFNLKHFPPIALGSHSIVAVHPDAFLLDILKDNEALCLLPHCQKWR